MKRLKNHLFVKWMLIAILILVLLVVGVYLYSYILGPPSLDRQQNTVFYSQDDQVIDKENSTGRGDWVKLADMPDTLVQSTLLAEDRHFYNHHGFDIPRIMGALWSDITSLSLKQGASTLTQQYARNLYLSFEKTWTRKLLEAFYTIRLEMFYDKDDILEGYLNTIYYGQGAYGIAHASDYYFNKAPKELSTAEASMLAGIPKGPSYYSPLHHPKRAKKRQKWILGLLKDHHVINTQDYQQAIEEKLAFTDPDEHDTQKKAPYFLDTALNEAATILDLDKERVRSGGYHIYTTLDTDKQKQLKTETDHVIPNQNKIEIGAIAMSPKHGEIRALVGGRHYKTSSFNRATQSKRMPGSAFKPFLYYTALENGYTPTTMLMSKPTAFKLHNGSTYQPSNFNGYYANKPISLAQALALSDNIYAVKTNLFLGVDKLVKTAKHIGIKSHLPHVPSLALGTATTSVDEMVNGYSVLANGGHRVNSYTVNKITNRNGKTLYQRKQPEAKQILDKKQTFVLTKLMTGMFDSNLNGYMSVTGSTIAKQLSRPYAGKSGSTDTDSWMIGYSPDLVTGIWMGYDDNRPIEKVKNMTYAKDIWAGFMEKAHKGTPIRDFTPPSGVVKIKIDPKTGKRATRYCKQTRDMYFIRGTEPSDYCTNDLPRNKVQQYPEAKKQHPKKGPIKRFFDHLF